MLYKCTYLHNRNRFTEMENKLMLTKAKGGERDRLGAWY